MLRQLALRIVSNKMMRSQLFLSFADVTTPVRLQLCLNNRHTSRETVLHYVSRAGAFLVADTQLMCASRVYLVGDALPAWQSFKRLQRAFDYPQVTCFIAESGHNLSLVDVCRQRAASVISNTWEQFLRNTATHRYRITAAAGDSQQVVFQFRAESDTVANNHAREVVPRYVREWISSLDWSANGCVVSVTWQLQRTDCDDLITVGKLHVCVPPDHTRLLLAIAPPATVVDCLDYFCGYAEDDHVWQLLTQDADATVERCRVCGVQRLRRSWVDVNGLSSICHAEYAVEVVVSEVSHVP